MRSVYSSARGWSFAVGMLLLGSGVSLFSQAPPATIDELRQTAKLIPGRRPLRINVVKFAESLRTKNFSVKGAPAEPSVQARTAFQVVYADGTGMIDSGMDRQ